MSRQHHFEVDVHVPCELWERPGKPEWRDHLHVVLNQRDALGIIERLAAALRSGEAFVSFDMFGEFEERESKP